MISISVVMPAYNTPVVILREAVESILSQTFRDFEFIIIDDGSTNDSVDYLNRLEDKRIRLIRNPENIGITKSLNIGFRAAQGKYIARMDSDDISLPTRFEKQYAFMERHPDVIICGTFVERFGNVSYIKKPVINDMELYRINTLFFNPGPIHPTAFFNRALLERYQITYDETLIYAQDYGLWAEIAKHGKICSLPEVLLKQRVHSQQISVAKQEKQIQCDLITQQKLLTQLLGEVTTEELALHHRYSGVRYEGTVISKEAANWFERLMAANAEKRIYDCRKFNRFVYSVIYKRLIRNALPKDASAGQRIKAFSHWMPFSAVAYIVVKMGIQKCRNVFRAKMEKEERIAE